MSKLVISEFMSLDGVVEDPAQEWAEQFDIGPEGGEFKVNETMTTECTLFGRVTYTEFAESWPNEQGDFADKFNSLPKYVVSRTLRNPSWKNTTVLAGDLETEIAALKDRTAGDIVVHGSAMLSRALLDKDLVDELRLIVYPIVMGYGRKLFGDTGAPVKLRLAESKPIGPDGVLLLVYRR